MRHEWGRIFPDVDTSPLEVFGRLRRINVLLQAESDRVLAVHNVSRADFDIISTLQRHQRSMTPTEIATSTLTSAAGTTKRLHRLVKVGMVTRDRNPDDGRGYLITLTAHGAEIIHPVLNDLSTLEHGLIDGLGAAEQRDAISALRFILDRLEQRDGDGADPASRLALADAS
jgi:DNA-binding MarR family transcriptional regulator